jgi:hypothetical protein
VLEFINLLLKGLVISLKLLQKLTLSGLVGLEVLLGHGDVLEAGI